MKGSATISDPDNLERPATTFGTVYADDRIVVGKDASLVLVFRDDGHIERIIAAGTFQVTMDGCQPNTGVERLAMPDQNRVLVGKLSKGPRGIVQGGVVLARSAAPGQIRPIPDSTVLSAKPIFSWPAEPKATKYTLNLYLQGNRVWSASSEAAEASYPGQPPLKSGAMYAWDVTTLVDNKTITVCQGVFHTASEGQRADAEALAKLIIEPKLPYLALAAMWHRQNGFVSEAIALDRQLAKLSGDPAVYWTLAELCWQAGLDEEARRAEQQAAALEKKAERKGQ